MNMNSYNLSDKAEQKLTNSSIVHECIDSEVQLQLSSMFLLGSKTRDNSCVHSRNC